PRSSPRSPTSSRRRSRAERTSRRCAPAWRSSPRSSRSTRASRSKAPAMASAVKSQVLDGKATAAAIKAELAERVAALAERGIRPRLGTPLVGDDPGSTWYVNAKHAACAELGIASIREDLPATATQEEIEAAVHRLNENPECTGFIVQLPLPDGIDTNRVLELIDPDKDADGLHPTNLGRLVLRTAEDIDSSL